MDIGDRYGDWTVLELFRHNSRPSARVVCKCGVEKIHIQRNLTHGNTKKCRGCSYADRGPLYAKRIGGDHLAAKDKFSDYKVKAKQRGIEFSLDFETFRKVAKEDCYYCGEPPSNINKIPSKDWAENFVYSGLDRLDNEVGYQSNNVVPCCKYCNYMKRELTYNEFFERVQRIAVRWPPGSAIVVADSPSCHQSLDHTKDMI